ncbi:hypothetical protein LC613_17890 [Nostoc sphaeroides CHAB 2801]|uniref:hypothetical protein n=1 Tax=Nostoc sphaeroides TaxID=446679 RepID=UPI0015F3273F|nr:hypothetical protein [Nostoc sphaeroides]MCC5629813.1 hypothetical protein [Nostoc sphaeroides CHAB 2801]
MTVVGHQSTVNSHQVKVIGHQSTVNSHQVNVQRYLRNSLRIDARMLSPMHYLSVSPCPLCPRTELKP